MFKKKSVSDHNICDTVREQVDWVGNVINYHGAFFLSAARARVTAYGRDRLVAHMDASGAGCGCPPRVRASREC